MFNSLRRHQPAPITQGPRRWSRRDALQRDHLVPPRAAPDGSEEAPVVGDKGRRSKLGAGQVHAIVDGMLKHPERSEALRSLSSLRGHERRHPAPIQAATSPATRSAISPRRAFAQATLVTSETINSGATIVSAISSTALALACRNSGVYHLIATLASTMTSRIAVARGTDQLRAVGLHASLWASSP